MPDERTPSTQDEPPTRSTAEIDAGWGALLDGIGHSGPLVVGTTQSAASEAEARELSLPTDDPDPPLVEAPPRVVESASAVPRPISTTDESWPRRDPVEIVALASGSHRVVRAPTIPPPRRPSTAEIAPIPPRSRWQLYAGGAVIVAAIGWFAMRPSDEPAPASTTALASASPPPAKKASEAPKKSEAPAVAPSPMPIEAKPVAPPPPVPAPAPAPAPVEVKPPIAPLPLAGTPTDLLTAAMTAHDESRFADAHSLAERAWKAERTNDAVRAMALAACEIPDGMLARDAFRKLDGPIVRKEAFVACKRTGIDLRAKVDGYTPQELLAMARRSAAAGDHEKAYEHAKASNRAGKSADALQLMAESACHNKDADAVAYLMGMLPKDRKHTVEGVCTTAGTLLPDAK